MKPNLKNKLFNSKITKDEFFKKYWNKKPYHFKSAIKNPETLGDFDDFFEMSYDEEFETRIVYEAGGEYPWQAKRGPLKKSDFKKNALWTLICHNLELFNPDLYNIKEELNFISNWHFDDVMATISKKGASVGAHIDDYSVFIFQGRGKRKWMLQNNPNPEYVPDIDIKLLQEFRPDTEIILEPGDMIYIPPNVAHHGVSLEDSISYSLGFKSIRFEQLLTTMLSIEELNLEKYNFHDHKNVINEDKFEVTSRTFQDLKQDLIQLISNDDILSSALLHHLSRPKNDIFAMEDIELNAKALKKDFRRDVWAKLVSMKKNHSTYLVAINKKTYLIDKEVYQHLTELFELSPHETFKLNSKMLKNKKFITLFDQLHNDGIFFIE